MNQNPMNINLDIAATLSAVIWPIVIVIILLAYRKKIPDLISGLAKRVTKLGFSGVSLELAVAKPFVPDWAAATGALDLRHTATAIQVNDSTAGTFSAQLREGGTADYAVVNLGAGEEWLTSRLFIMAIVFAQVKEVEGFVFLETAGSVRKSYIGWAEPARIRWSLARRYPWLEQAYADAYSTIMSQQRGFVVSSRGRLGFQWSSNDPGPSISLIQEFLQRVQQQLPPPPGVAFSSDWTLVDGATNTYEHSSWINGEKLEEILGNDCDKAAVRSSELRSQSTSEQVRPILSAAGRFVAVLEDDRRLEYLVDRQVLLEQVAKQMSSETDSRS